MEKSIVNIILPTYNRPDKAYNTINTFRNQTISNYIMIVIDDGSTKDNYNKLKKYIDNLKDNRIILLQNIVNSGIPTSLNIALSKCTLKYITWISDDNNYNNNYLEVLLNTIKPNKQFAYAGHLVVNEVTGKSKLINKQYINTIDIIKHFKGIVSFIWDTDFIKNIVGKYNENINNIEDFDFKIRTFICANKIGFSPECLVKFIRHKQCLYYKNKELIVNRRIYITDMYTQFLEIMNKINKQIVIYISKTRYTVMYQRPHQLINFLNKNKYFKIFVTSENICNYNKDTNTWIINFDFYESIMYLLNNKQVIIYYTNPQLIHSILKFKKHKIIFDLIDNPVDEFKSWSTNLKSVLQTADEIIYSHKYLYNIITKYISNKRLIYINNGVDYLTFSKSSSRIDNRPIDFPNLNKPIIGYYGSISTWVDYNLIKKIADIDSIHIVMIGYLPNNKYISEKYQHKSNMDTT